MIAKVRNYDGFVDGLCSNLGNKRDIKEHNLTSREGFERAEIYFKDLKLRIRNKPGELRGYLFPQNTDEQKRAYEGLESEHNVFMGFLLEGSWAGQEKEKMRDLANLVVDVIQYTKERRKVCLPKTNRVSNYKDMPRMVYGGRELKVQVVV